MTPESTALSLFSRAGGVSFFERLVDEFYGGVETDDVLAPLYPEYPDFSGARHRLATDIGDGTRDLGTLSPSIPRALPPGRRSSGSRADG